MTVHAVTGMGRTTTLVAAALVLAACGDGGPHWSRFQSSDGLFSVEFPGTPSASTKQAVALMPTVVHTVVLERGSAGIMQVSHHDLAAETRDLAVDALLRIECGHPFAESNFRPTEPESRMIASRQGVVITGTAAKSKSLEQGGWEQDSCVIVGERMYHLIAIGPDNAATRKDGARFLRSFRATAAR